MLNQLNDTSRKIIINTLAKFIKKEYAINIDNKNIIHIESFLAANYATLHNSVNVVETAKTIFDFESLINSLTINETYFFRDSAQMNFLRKDLVKRLVCNENPEGLTIWSLGCSSGEEPYSLAILCEELNSLNKVKIHAFDINTDAIHKAKKGIYTKWSFRGVEDKYIQNYFTKIGENEYKIHEEIRHGVKFHNFNIKKDLFDPEFSKKFGKPNIVLCRNILMYFEEETFVAIANRISELLSLDGYVLTSAQETYILKKACFSQKVENDTFIFYKCETLPKNIKSTKVNESKEIHKDHNENYENILKNTKLLIESQELENALSLCNFAIQEKPHEFLAYLIKAKILLLCNNMEEAFSNIRKALFVNSKCPFVHYEYGKILKKVENTSKAKKHLEKALKLISHYDNNFIFELLSLNKETLIKMIKLDLEELTNA